MRAEANNAGPRALPPLHVAAGANNAEGVRLLLRYGADRAARDPHGRTVVEFAAEARLASALLVAVHACECTRAAASTQ